MPDDLDTYTWDETLKNGVPYRIRPIQADDANRMGRLFRACSPQTMYFRFMIPLDHMPRRLVQLFCTVDGDKEFALVAEVRPCRRRELIGACRWMRDRDTPDTAQIMLVVADGWTNLGAGRTLYRRIMPVARAKGLRTMRGLILDSNLKMISMLVNSEFRISSHIEDDMFVFSFDL